MRDVVRVGAWGAIREGALFAPFATQSSAMAYGSPVAVVAEVPVPSHLDRSEVDETWAEVEASDRQLWCVASPADRASPRSLVGGV